MKKWPWRKILAIAAVVLVVVGIAPIAALLWDGWTHNNQPLAMGFPLRAGQYTSPEFTTDRDESYFIGMAMSDATGPGTGLNADAVLDLDWKITDLKGAVIASGSLNQSMGRTNTVNLGEYAPKRGLRQKMTFNLHRDFEEPAGSKVTLEVETTEDPEGRAFGFILFARWAAIVGGAGGLLLLVLLTQRIMRRAHRGKTSKIPETP